MKKFKISGIVILCLLGLVFSENSMGISIFSSRFDLDVSKFCILSNANNKYNYLKNGVDYEIVLKERWAVNFCRSIFIINKDLVCLALGEYINYYDYSTKKIIRSVKVSSNSLAAAKNSSGDLLVFSGGILYDYDYKNDKLTVLKDNHLEKYKYCTYYPSLYIHPNKISYSKTRNSVFYSAYIDFDKKIKGVYELSLKDYSVTLRGRGFCPQVNDAQSCIYYINSNQKNIIKADFKDFKEQPIFKYHNELRDMVVVDEETIFFVHASEKASITGFKFDTFKIYDKKKVKSVYTKGKIYRSPFDVFKAE